MKNTLPEISLISFEIIRYDIAIQSHVSINVILNSNDSTIPFLVKEIFASSFACRVRIDSSLNGW